MAEEAIDKGEAKWSQFIASCSHELSEALPVPPVAMLVVGYLPAGDPLFFVEPELLKVGMHSDSKRQQLGQELVAINRDCSRRYCKAILDVWVSNGRPPHDIVANFLTSYAGCNRSMCYFNRGICFCDFPQTFSNLSICR